MRLVGILSLVALSACASKPVKRSLDLGEGVVLELPAPRDIMMPLRAVQTLTVRHGQGTRTFQAILQNQGSELTLAIVTPFWPTPLKASYDGQRYHVDRSLQSHVPFDFQYVLADIVLVYADALKLSGWLKGSGILEDKGQRRTLTGLHAVRPLVQVSYDAIAKPWVGTIHLRNFLREYEIDITTEQVVPL